MRNSLLHQLHADGLLSATSVETIRHSRLNRPFSVHWEIRTVLYLGILLLTSGIGILVYKNIDTIGHQAILLFIGLVCAGSFYYCNKHKVVFSTTKVAAPTAWFDYILLLGCSMFIIFIAYLQYQYHVFGDRYGLATFFPMLVLFFSAYYFDHLGVLSMAITALAGWLGITITPLRILESNDFHSSRIIFTGIFIGIFLVACGWLSSKRRFKAHFNFTYTNFGIHVVMISCLAAMFEFGFYLPWFVLLLGVAFFFYKKALQDRAFYFLVVATLYAYIGTSYVVVNLLERIRFADLGAVYLGFIYFIASGIGLILFLINTNKKIKAA